MLSTSIGRVIMDVARSMPGTRYFFLICCILHGISVSSSLVIHPQNVEAAEGDKLAELECGISDDQLAVMWIFTSSCTKSTEYIRTYGGTEIETKFANKITIDDSRKGQSILRIHYITPSDAGTYACGNHLGIGHVGLRAELAYGVLVVTESSDSSSSTNPECPAVPAVAEDGSWTEVGILRLVVGILSGVLLIVMIAFCCVCCRAVIVRY